MNTEEIYTTLESFIASQILKQPQRKISPTEALFSGGLIDSFHQVDLALYVEDAFGVRLEDTELGGQAFDTLAELVQLIQQRRGERE